MQSISETLRIMAPSSSFPTSNSCSSASAPSRAPMMFPVTAPMESLSPVTLTAQTMASRMLSGCLRQENNAIASVSSATHPSPISAIASWSDAPESASPTARSMMSIISLRYASLKHCSQSSFAFRMDSRRPAPPKMRNSIDERNPAVTYPRGLPCV